MIDVLMIGNHPSNKGGMTSVIEQIRTHDWAADGVSLSFIPTYLPGGSVKKSLFFLIAYVRILFRLITSKPDIVHMHMSYKGSFTRKWLVHRLCKAFRVKDIIHLHGSEFAKWYEAADEDRKKRIRTLLSECDELVVLGEEWKKTVLRISHSARVRVISNAVALPEQTVQWNDQRCQILFLGVLIPRKGVSDLIKAAARLRDARKLGRIRFVIAGTGEEEERLKNEVRQSGLNDVFSFSGWVDGDKKNALFLSSQILVSPSKNEGLPVSVLEGASYGMPIVSTDVGDIPSVVENGRNGFLFSPGDTDALAEGLLRAASRETFERMSTASRKIIETSFSIDSFFGKLLDLYKDLGDENG